MVPRPFRVVRRSPETSDTWTLVLEPADGLPLEFAPGQFTMVYAFGVGEVPVSICGERGGPLVHTVRDVGAVSGAICRSKPGAVLGIRGPFGRGWPAEEAEGADVVIVAGGIGLPPLRPALYECLRRRSEYGDVVLLYGSRTPADLVYKREVERWRSRFDVEVDVTVDRGEEGWRGNVGVVPKLVAGARFDPASAVAMVCGPEIMMRFAAEALLERGVRADRVYVSMERHMDCGVGHCGHCQLGPTLICRDGPVYRWDEILPLTEVREL
jgi:NAD(P)H-flavin reductase